ncbi:hypothetical protein EV175_006790, partial [Coemansia sp. RSA 1933]
MDGLNASSDSCFESQCIADFLASIHTAASPKGISKKPMVQEAIAAVASELVGKAQGQSVTLASEQALVWIRLLRAIVQFPAVYWTSEQIRVIFALAFVADLGIAKACANVSDTQALQMVSRKIMEQLLGHTPGLALLIADHLEPIADSWMASAQASDLILSSSRKTLGLIVGALAQASYVQASDAANTACRKLCMHLFQKLDQAGLSNASTDGMLIMDMFSAVAGVAKKCAKKVQPDRRKEWAALTKRWEHKLVQTVQAKLSSIGGADAADGLYETCCLGVLVSLQSIVKSLDETE